ncbi:MAG: hypothetical protein WCI74_20870, partial [Actinomycetes bacterium]
FGICVEVAGAQLEADMEAVMERRIHDFCNWIEGFMHLNQRDGIWLRADKKAVARGLTLNHVGMVLIRLFRSALPIIDRISVTLITDPALVLADEPTGNLDSKSADEIANLLKQAAEEWGRAIVMVTHDVTIASHAHRIVFMRDGAVVDDVALGADPAAEARQAMERAGLL